MKHPLPGDFIDIHTHDSRVISGIYAVENLMAHEWRSPGDIGEQPCTYGIHPWHLSSENIDDFVGKVKSFAASNNIVAVGEAGFDKLKGPDMQTQAKAFQAQVEISEEIKKPLYIHCVRAWDELMPAHKRLRPKMPWMIHGFRGNVELAMQLLSKGMYLSFWFDFVIRPESSKLLKSLPTERIFLETDGANVDIRDLYKKVAADLNMEVNELKGIILANSIKFFTPVLPPDPPALLRRSGYAKAKKGG
jgi:TatD DNase family protein